LSRPSFDSSLIIECDEFDVKFDDRFEDEFSRDVVTSSLLPLGMSGRALVSLVRSCRRCKVRSFDSDGRKISILDGLSATPGASNLESRPVFSRINEMSSEVRVCVA